MGVIDRLSEASERARRWRDELAARHSKEMADANEAVRLAVAELEAAKRAEAEKIPVDRTAVTLTDGSPVTPDHRELKSNGQQKGYVVLSAEERAKGFVRPPRQSYKHLKCGTVTTMSLAIAETYARDFKFYSGTFCMACGDHFPVGENGEFVWYGTEERVGT